MFDSLPWFGLLEKLAVHEFNRIIYQSFLTNSFTLHVVGNFASTWTSCKESLYTALRGKFCIYLDFLQRILRFSVIQSNKQNYCWIRIDMTKQYCVLSTPYLENPMNQIGPNITQLFVQIDYEWPNASRLESEVNINTNMISEF